MIRHRIFLGSSNEAKSDAAVLARELEQALGDSYEVTPWWRAPDWENLRSTLTGLGRAVREYDYGVFLCSPDDKGTVRGEGCFLPRDNVIFEFGLFLSALGPDHTFLLEPQVPSPHVFRVLTDVGSNHRPHYKCDKPDSGRFSAEDGEMARLANTLAASIRGQDERLEALLGSPKLAEAALKREVGRYRTELAEQAALASQTGMLSVARSHLSRLLLLKAAATERSLQDALEDLGNYIERIDDMLSIEQLAQRQRLRKGDPDDEIQEVWVFASRPLEFLRPEDKEVRRQVDLLQDTIVENIKADVRYTYFVGGRFEEENIANFLTRRGVPLHQLRNVSVVKLDPRGFKTAFTMHRFKGREEVYMSSLMDQRNDLLIKVSDTHMERIRTCLEHLRGYASCKSGVQVTQFVLERAD